MRGMLALVAGMGVAILVALGVLGVLVARRLSGPGDMAGEMALAAPAGTRIGAVAALGPDRLAVALRDPGAGGDQVVVVDPARHRVVARLRLAPPAP